MKLVGCIQKSLTLATFGLLGVLAWAATPAGTLVTNQAEITFIDGESGRLSLVRSNLARLSVAELRAMDIEDDRNSTVYAGQTVNLPHRLYNTGNIVDSYNLTLTDVSGDSGALLNPRLIHDLNGNGVADAGEPELAGTPNIDAGASIDLVIIGTVPATSVVGDTFQMSVQGESQTDGSVSDANIDTLTVDDQAHLLISKQSSQACDTPLNGGDELGYDIRFDNIGDQLLNEQFILLNGASEQGVLLQDELPYGTHLFKPQVIDFAPVQAVPVVQLFSQAGSDTWITFDDWDGIAPVSSIGLFFKAQFLERNQIGQLAFNVRIFDSVTATQILNQAFIDDNDDNSAEFVSNEVCNTLAGPEAAIRFVSPSLGLLMSGAAPNFVNDSDFSDTPFYLRDLDLGDYSLPRDGVYIELTSSGLSPESYAVLPDGRRSVVVTLGSSLTGHSLQVELQETAPGSGVFRSVRPVELDYQDANDGGNCPVSSGLTPGYDAGDTPECLLLASENDKLIVTFFDAVTGTLLDDSAIVDPLGEVFDSSTLLPIEGAIVNVLNTDGSLAIDPLTGLPLDPRVTGADGMYRFPRMFPGDYYLSAQPPGDYRFPSIVPADVLFGKIISDASYGKGGFDGVLNSGVFTLNRLNPIVTIDIPLDIDINGAGLLIEKEASKTVIEIASLVEYTVKVKNTGSLALTDADVFDHPAYGFKYIPGTARLNGQAISDPVREGSQLVFAIGDLAAADMAVLQYVMQATAGAIDGDGINRARARAEIGNNQRYAESNLARAKVEVRRTGVLSDRAFIFGKIYVDSDCNDIQNDAEWPIGGVKVFMEDGTYAITDENGQYSLYGLKPGMHAVKLDPLTLPEHIQLKPIDNRHAGAPDSRFVDLLPGEFHRADFAAQCPTPEDAESILVQLKARNGSVQGDWMLEEASRFDPNSQLRNEDDVRKARRTGGDLSSGLIGRQQSFRGNDDLDPEDFVVRTSAIPQQSQAMEDDTEVSMPLTMDVVKTVTQAQAKEGTWLWPTTDVSYTGRFMAVIKAGINPDLYVNGEKVAHTKLGEQVVNKRERAQVMAWYGVELSEGDNLVEVKGVDSFGNERVLASSAFKRPARGVSLAIEPEREELNADGGRSTVPVAVKVLDRNGYPAQGVYFVTVEASDGSWLEEDIQKSEPGHQLKVVNGETVLHLRSSERTGNVILRASFEQMTAESEVVQVASLRPLVGLGLIDYSWRKNHLSHDGSGGPTGQKDGMKDGYQSDGRGALLLKGRVMDDYHLTLSYDTDKEDDTELLRDIDPNEYYPINGDNSVRGFEAQSRDKLFAKLEKGRSSVMWGDYVTDVDSGYEDLSRVQRTLTGGRAIYDDGVTRAIAFGAEEKDSRGEVEISGNGTAMLYTIEAAPVIRNSEVVELVTRDRDNRGLIVNVESMTRFSDYSIDYLSGDIRFTRSIPTLDDELNPVSVRISYDLEGDGKEYLIAGARIEHNITDNITVGGSYTKDEHALEGYELGGGFVEYRVGDQTRILASAASMDHEDKFQENGDAAFVTLEHRWLDGSTSKATWGKTDSGFTNSSGGVGSGREETRIEHRQTITDKLSVNAQVLESESLDSEDTRKTKELTADYRISDWTVRAGGRVIEQETAVDDEKITTALVGVGRSFTLLDRPGNVAVEYEQETGENSRKRWMGDVSWQAHEKARVYGRYEQINSLTGITGLSKKDEEVRTSIGIETDWLPSTSIYNEYRLEGGIDGRDLEAATGIRGDYELEPGLAISPSFEMIDTLSGEKNQDNIALSVGYRDTRNENSRKIARAEVRKSDNETYYGLDMNYVARVNDDWSSFVREDLRWSVPDGDGGDRIDHTFTLGLARRPREDNKHHMLFMYQWMEDRGDGATEDRTAHLLSTHNNVQLNGKMIWSGRVGFKYEEYDLLGKTFDSNVGLADTRLTWDLSKRFDLDVHGGVLGTNDFDEYRYSYGVGLNFLVRKNLRIGVGYNFAGFEEKDLDGEGYNVEGVYFGIQYKFDEKMFSWLKGDNN